MAGLRSFINVPLANIPAAIRSGQSDGQLLAGYLDVTKPPYNANKTGAANATAAIQQALDDGYLYNLTTWVPKGTYLIGQLVLYQIDSFGAFGRSNRKHAMFLLGDVTGGTFPTLKAIPGLGAIPLINTVFRGAQDFAAGRVYVTVMRGFNIDMGNNPTSSGISYACAQGCSLEDINIFGTAFLTGISDLPGSGGSATNIKVTGGTTGITNNDYRPTPSIQNCELLNQTGQAVLNNGSRGSLIFAGFRIVGSGAGYAAFRAGAATSGSHPQRNWVLCDGSIELSGGATIAVDSISNYLYMRNVYVKAATISRQTSSGVTLAGNAAQWLRVREYAFAPNGVTVNGVATAVNGTSNLGLEQVAGPPAGLGAIHGWSSTDFPVWPGAQVIDIREHGAVQADTDAVNGVDNTAALEAAFAAGVAQGRPVFVPRGFWYIRQTLDIPLGAVIIGASLTNSVIMASRHWAPGAPIDMVRTADGVGTVKCSDVCFNGHEATAVQNTLPHRFVTLFNGRASNMYLRDTHVNRREWWNGIVNQQPACKFTGNAGGRMWNLGLDIFVANAAPGGIEAPYRTVQISGTSRPLAIYNPDVEGTNNPAGPQFEIINCSNVTLYGLKHEAGIELLDIVNSNNICILGGSGNYTLSQGAMYDTSGTTNFVLTVLARQGVDLTVPFMREDGVQRVPGPAKILGMVKRGNPVPYGELVGVGGPVVTTSQQQLSTGATGSIGAGDHLLITVAGMRNATASDISDLDWTAPLESSAFVNGGGDLSTIGIAFGQDSITGTKSSTATWLNSGTGSPAPAAGAIAAILVFTVT